MDYLVVGCSYRSAGLDLRERLANDQRTSALESLGSRAFESGETLLLCTCNRVEIYAAAVSRSLTLLEQELRMLLARQADLSAAELAPFIYCHSGEQAVRHIFRVTSSLDAMVVGEPQITGQVKGAFARARARGGAGAKLCRCLEHAFLVAKRIRNETEVSRHPASVSSVAADLARRVFENLDEAAVLVVGAGEMSELALRDLTRDGGGRIRVVNRDYARAQRLAEGFNARAVPFDALADQLLWADVIISSTASAEPIVTRNQLSQIMKRRKQRPLFVADIAVPRDFEPAARSLSNVYLFAVDDLEKALEDNLRARRRAAKSAERIVEFEVMHFKDRLRRAAAGPLIGELRQAFLNVASAEADRAAKKLQVEDRRQRQTLELMAESIVNKLLHGPVTELKKSAETGDDAVLAEATRRLFRLQEHGTPDHKSRELSAAEHEGLDAELEAVPSTGKGVP